MENNDQRIFDETYSIKYIKRINVYKYYLLINSCICFIGLILFFFRFIKNEGIIIGYIFFSMGIFHVAGGILASIRGDNFKKQKDGESLYYKNYYPDIWEKINPLGEVIIYSELLKYENMLKDIDPNIDKIRNDKITLRRKEKIYLLPFFLIFFFNFFVFVNLFSSR
jgi:hypothetical protein